MAETKRHYTNWWNHKGIVLNMWEHFQEGVTPHADIPEPEAPRDLNQKWFDTEWRARYLDWYVAHSSLMADMLPVANTQLGPGSLAAILGGVFEGGEDTIWIHPDPDYTDNITFNPNHPNYLLHKELLKACKRRSQGHYYVGMPDLMEGLDVLAAIKGTDKVLLDTVMQPEVLERQMQQINDIYFHVFNELYDIIREGDEMAFCYFSSWAPGKMSKLQCDISTMISVDDYLRFVQPYIREQCQKIDYTLYHLDGVGAMHHLDALLEIEELNAIQWTPGVGEPQGGSPKWYDMYRRILAAGKSIMACWVTLDELRPLLDNVGGNGIHLEMDFHNECEVEQAMRIIEEYQESEDQRAKSQTATAAIHVPTAIDDADREVESIIQRVEAGLAAELAAEEGSRANEEASHTAFPASLNRILVLDGAMGTMIQQYNLREEDFRGARFATHDYDLKGCNDVLSLTCPVVIRDIHRKYLDAGADIIETNTFNAQAISLSDYGLEAHVRDINLSAAAIARQCAQEYSTADKPRYVAGSIGPTNRTSSISTGNGLPLDKTLLRKAYEEQIRALAVGGVDVLLIETIFDVENARIAIDAARSTAPELPLMLSFTVSVADGHNMLGQDITDFLNSIDMEGIFSVGVNCLADVALMTPLVCRLSQYGTHVSLYPNAGRPDSAGHYKKTPESLVHDLWPLLEGHALSVVGGCCGTTDKHIRLIAKAIQPATGLFLSPLKPGSAPDNVAAQTAAAPAATTIATTGSAPQGATPQDAAAPISLFDAILHGKADAASEATRLAIADGAQPQELINNEMIRAMSEVGQQFQDGKAFVPQLLMAGRAMKASLELLKPMLAGTGTTSVGKVVIGTVKGDLHDIGKNLVASMLEGCGFEVVNIGIDVSAEKFIDEIKKNQPDILCMSALLTTTMGYMRDVIDALEKAGLRQQVKIMVGGAPVTQGFADEIGADGYSDNANSAVAVAKQLLAAKSTP